MEKLRKFNSKSKNPNYDVLKDLDMEVFYNIIWTLAKTADKKIPEPIEWLDEFEEFPLFEILPQLQELISNSLRGSKQKKT
jgi:hypothetical protein